MSPRVLNKESARVPQRFREKPFVVSEASEAEGKGTEQRKILILIIY